MKKKISTEDNVENIMCKNSEYISKCINIIYYNFNSFGWTYGENEVVTRLMIRETIRELLEDSLLMKCEHQTGRINVDYLEGELSISLAL